MLDTRHAVKGVSRDAVVEQQLFNVNPYVAMAEGTNTSAPVVLL